jgi:hypothetical protein
MLYEKLHKQNFISLYEKKINEDWREIRLKNLHCIRIFNSLTRKKIAFYCIVVLIFIYQLKRKVSSICSVKV